MPVFGCFGNMAKSKPRPKPDVGIFTTILGLLLAVLIPILQMNGLEITWEWSLLSYSVILVGFVWTYLTHAVPHRGPYVKRFGALIIAAIIGWLGWLGTHNQYLKQHPITPTLWITLQTLPGLPEGVTNNSHLRYCQILVRNSNDVEIDNFCSRLQLPEPIDATIETNLPPGTMIGWRPLLTKYSITGTGNKRFLGPNSSRNYLFYPSACFFPAGNKGQLTGYSEGGDLTGVWELTIDKIPSHDTVSLSFLTSNDGDATNYIALANTEFKTNGAAISTTMRGDGNGGSILMNLTMAIIINTNYAVNPKEDWHFGTNWLRFYFEGLYQYPAVGKPGSQHFLVPFVFNKNAGAISSLPIRSEDGKWRRVLIEYQ
jgi:hypothetical protein